MDHNLIPIFLFLTVASFALFSFLAVATWSDNRRRERESYYRNETVKKISETGAGASVALELVREQERQAALRRREGFKVSGLIIFAAGLGFTIFLATMAQDHRAFTIGLIPTFVGVALLAYTYSLAPKLD
jgi:NADH:ubiquinone oxidoreductase subunit 3 (subunit A)